MTSKLGNILNTFEYTDVDVDDLNQQEIARRIRHYMPRNFQQAAADFPLDKTRSWYLWGSVGVGKTHQAYALMRESIVRSVTQHTPIARVVNWPESVMHYKNAPFEEKTGYAQQLQRGALIVDDLGAEYLNDQALEFLWVILNKRIERREWTGFTSNVSIGDLPYDDRIKSRIIGFVGTNRTELEGVDRRFE